MPDNLLTLSPEMESYIELENRKKAIKAWAAKRGSIKGSEYDIWIDSIDDDRIDSSVGFQKDNMKFTEGDAHFEEEVNYVKNNMHSFQRKYDQSGSGELSAPLSAPEMDSVNLSKKNQLRLERYKALGWIKRGTRFDKPREFTEEEKSEYKKLDDDFGIPDHELWNIIANSYIGNQQGYEAQFQEQREAVGAEEGRQNVMALERAHGGVGMNIVQPAIEQAALGISSRASRVVGLGAKALGGITGSEALSEFGEFGDTFADKMNREADFRGQSATMADELMITKDGLLDADTKRMLIRGARGASASMIEMSVASAAGPYGMLAFAGTGEANQAYTEGKDMGLSGTKLAAYTTMAGVVEFVVGATFQKLGMGGAESAMVRKMAWNGLLSAMKKAGISMAQEIPEELLTELSHETRRSIAKYGMDPTKWSAAAFEQVATDTLIQTMMMTGFANAKAETQAYLTDPQFNATKKLPKEMKIAAKVLGLNLNLEADRNAFAERINHSQEYVRNERMGMVESAMEAGLSEEAVGKALDKAIEAENRGKNFNSVFTREANNAYLQTEQGATEWTHANPQIADALMTDGNRLPSRTDFKKVGLPKMGEEARADFVETAYAVRQNMIAEDAVEAEAALDAPEVPDVAEQPEVAQEAIQAETEAMQPVKEQEIVETDDLAIKEAEKARKVGNLTKKPQKQKVKEAKPTVKQEQQEKKSEIAQPETATKEVTEANQKAEEKARKIANLKKVDRRSDVIHRKEVDEMTDEEKDVALLTSDMTGLPNKRAYYEGKTDGVHHVSGDEFYQRDLSTGDIGSYDIDDFKKINDTHGHHVGDEVIRFFGKVLADSQTGSIVETAEAARKHLEDNHFELEYEDGSIEQIRIGFSYGSGKTLAEAEVGLQIDKRKRKLLGKRTGQRNVDVGGLGESAEGDKAEAGRKSTVSQAVAPDTKSGDFVSDKEIVRVDVSDIKTDAKRFQYKLSTSESGVREEIEGPFDDRVSGIILLWQSKDNELFVVNGHHRLDLAKREGIGNVRAVIVREEDGITPDDARLRGAIENIKSGRGSTNDTAEMWRLTHEKDLETTEKEYGGNPKNTVGYKIGRYATDEVYDAWRNGILSDKQAASISQASKNNVADQKTGLEYIKEHSEATASDISRFIEAGKFISAQPKQVQGGLFGGDTEFQEAQAARQEVNKEATKKLNQLKSQRATIRQASKVDQSQAAADYGIEVKTDEDLNALERKLDEDIEKYENYWLHPEIMSELQHLASGGMGNLFEQKTDAKTEEKQEKPPSTGGGLFAEVSEYDPKTPQPEGLQSDEDSNQANPLIFGMPDMIDMLKNSGGVMPKILERIPIMGGRAAGVFRGHGSNVGIELRADIFVGPRIAEGYAKKDDVDKVKEQMLNEILEGNSKLNEDDISIKEEFDMKRGKVLLTFLHKDPTYARRVLAHEIGHWADFMPDETMKRGNILGRIGKLSKYLKTTLDKLPTDPSKALTKKDRMKLRRKAENKVGPRPAKDNETDLAAWRDEVRGVYQEMVGDEINHQNLMTRQEVMNELKKLTQWWKPFNTEADAGYTKYRHSGAELYADALSVLLNNPAALQKRAPVFYKSFFAYMENSPETRDAYNQVSNEIKAGASGDRSRARVRDAMTEGDEAHRVESEKEAKPSNSLMDTIGTLFLDRFYKLARLITRAKNAGEVEVNPMDSIDAAKYSGSQIQHYANRVSREVGEYLKKNNLSDADLGEYMFYMRAINERSEMANPIVGDKAGAEQALKAMRNTLGLEAMKNLETARKAFRQIREQTVLAQIKDSGAYDQDFVDMLLDREYYATFEVVEYIEKKHGKGSGHRFLRQIGTLKGVSNPLSATMQTDISLIRSLGWNQAKRDTVRFLLEHDSSNISESEKKWDGKKHTVVETTERNKGTVSYMSDGQEHSYDIDSTIANSFSREFNEQFGDAAKILRWFSQPARIWFTTIRPGFQVFNAFFRDPLRTIKNIEGLGIRPHVLYKNLFKSMVAASLDVSGNPDAILEEMRKNGLLISWSNVGGMDTADTQTERILGKYSETNAWHSEITNPFKKWLNRLLIAGDIGELANKRAGYIYLKDNQAKLGLTDNQINHMVRHWVGSPSFITGGSATPITNNIFMFSNAMAQGWRSDIEAFKANKAQVAAKTLAYSIAPKAMQITLASGALLALVRAMGYDDEDKVVQWLESMKVMYDRISSYQMENYTAVPLGMTDGGKTIFLRIPQDETGRVIGGLFSKVMSGKDGKEMLQDIIKHGGDQTPNINPLAAMAWDSYSYMVGVNPYDSFRRRNAVPDTEWKAGGMDSHKAFGKWLWNNYGGNFIYKFSNKTPGEAVTETEQFLQLPFMGDLAGRFIKVSDYGLLEKAKEAKKEVESKRATETLSIRSAVKKKMSGDKLSEEEKKLLLSDSGAAKRYQKTLERRTGDQVQRMIDVGITNREKKAIIVKLFSEGDKRPELIEAKNAFVARQAKRLSAKPRRRKREKSSSYKERLNQHKNKNDEAMELIKGLDVDLEAIERIVKEGYKVKRIRTKSRKLTSWGAKRAYIRKMLRK